MTSRNTEGLTITISHEPTGLSFKFPNTGMRVFSESYSSEWNEESVFGRMDPIVSYKGTRRNISLEFIVSDTGAVASAEQLAVILYPTYTSDNAISLRDPPLARIYIPGFLQSTDSVGQLCAISSYSLDRGTSYNDRTGDRTGEIEANTIIVNIELTPLHEYDLGWIEENGSYTFGGSAAQNRFYFSNKKIGK